MRSFHDNEMHNWRFCALMMKARTIHEDKSNPHALERLALSTAADIMRHVYKEVSEWVMMAKVENEGNW